MSDPIGLALIILGLPLAAALLAWLSAGNAALKRYAHVPLIIACGTAAVLAFVLLNKILDGDLSNYTSEPVTWFAAGHLKVRFTITVDALSAIMLGMITFISTMIAVFSGGYMHGDKGYARFFAVMGLFVFSMCGLVLANNFLLLVAFWEGVGLCSYLLIGYYYEKPSAATAARKAFLYTRVGDTGFLLGIFFLWRMGGWNTDLNLLFEHISPGTRRNRGRSRPRACCCSAGRLGRARSSRCTCGSRTRWKARRRFRRSSTPPRW